MPRKTSHKKNAAVAEVKPEVGSTRRSGRAAPKPAPSTSAPAVKDTNRSRRSSTAAQTAASVADSKSPKVTRGSHGDTATPPPSEGGSRGKSARRSSSLVNYRESDGEEEGKAQKFDENFESEEEFEESDSEVEKVKPKGKGRPSRAAAKSKSPKKGGRGKGRGRGRPKKKSIEKDSEEEEDEEEEEAELFDVTDDSADAVSKPAPAKSRRGRKPKAEVAEKPEPKSSRRSVRAASKEESPKKRPSRGQTKKYVEDEEDIEEIDLEPVEGGSTKKRKREESPQEVSKRPKKDDGEKAEEANEDEKSDEPMEVDDTVASEETKKELSETSEVKKDDVASVESEEEEEEDAVTKEEKMEDPAESVKPVEEEEEEAAELVADKKTPTAVSQDLQKEDSSDSLKIVEESSEGFKSSESEQVLEPEKAEDTHTADANLNNSEHESEPDISDPVEQKEPAEIAPLPVESVVDTPPIETSPISSAAPVDIVPLVNNTPAEIVPNSNTTPVPDSAPIPSSAPLEAAPVSVDVPAEVPKESSVNGTEPVHITNSVEAPVVNSVAETPTANGEYNSLVTDEKQQQQTTTPALPGRKYVPNSKLADSGVKPEDTFGFVSFNLGNGFSIPKEKLLKELDSLRAHIICLQQVPKLFYSSVLEPSMDVLGFKSVFCQPEDSLKGMATFYKSSLFRLSGQSEVSLKKLIDKELETALLDPNHREAVRTHVRKCGNVLFMQFSTVLGSHTVTVANVMIPPSDISINALQVACLAQEAVRETGGASRPLLLGGEFNAGEKDASYQLLRDGYLSNDLIEDLQHRKDVFLPGSENASLLNLLWKSFQHPSSNLRSCYSSVLDREFTFPDQKSTSPDLLWYSLDSLNTVGVLDVEGDTSSGDRHVSLKADISFIQGAPPL